LRKTLFLLVFLTACNHFDRDRNSSSELRAMKKNYYAYLDKTCFSDEYYDGLRNTFQYTACLLDNKVLDMQLDMNRLAFLWSDEEYYDQQVELDKSKSKETVVFLSFYSPDRKLIDLDQKSTAWKVYLLNGEKRYKASSIIKMPNKYEYVKNLYPQHSHWGVAYHVKFEKSMEDLERDNLKFIITSREGYSKMEIPIGSLD